MACTLTGSTVAGRSGVTLMARVLGQGGEPITRASLSSITYAVTDLGLTGEDPGTPQTGTLTVASVVFDDLQQSDPRWQLDGAARPGSDGRWGYNFRATLPASLFTSYYRQQCDVVFTPVSGEPFRIVFGWTPRRVYA